MKSSTLYRSNLSKEKMMQLEGFKTRNGYQSNISYEENAPSVYVRPKKEKELDTLLGSFNVPTRSEKTPMVYLISGFLPIIPRPEQGTSQRTQSAFTNSSLKIVASFTVGIIFFMPNLSAPDLISSTLCLWISQE